jgi:hypothetical protein
VLVAAYRDVDHVLAANDVTEFNWRDMNQTEAGRGAIPMMAALACNRVPWLPMHTPTESQRESSSTPTCLEVLR